MLFYWRDKISTDFTGKSVKSGHSNPDKRFYTDSWLPRFLMGENFMKEENPAKDYSNLFLW